MIETLRLAAARLAYIVFGALVISLAGALIEAQAADATLTWSHPTQYTDNSPIPAGALTQTAVIYGKCNATQTGLLTTPAPVTLTVAYPATSRVITGLGEGSWCFAARSETASAQSAWTGYVFKTIVLTPKPPVLSSTITLAYETWKFLGKTYLGRYVGTIELGTPCQDGAVVTTSRATYYEIDPASVTLTEGRTPRPGPIVTQCEAA
jgi:hypothetical protein